MNPLILVNLAILVNMVNLVNLVNLVDLVLLVNLMLLMIWVNLSADLQAGHRVDMIDHWSIIDHFA